MCRIARVVGEGAVWAFPSFLEEDDHLHSNGHVEYLEGERVYWRSEGRRLV